MGDSYSLPWADPLTYTFAGGVAGLICLGYYCARPKPIPGIPYNKEATKSILGDIRPMMKHAGETNELWDWISAQSTKLNSPIIQLFLRPLGRPWVIITDFREAQDILQRRTKEFDRSGFVGDVFNGIIPEHHFTMKTNEVFKQHREWVKDLMAPNFLNNVAAPQIHTSFTNLVQLWREKSRLAEGHPFLAPDDIYRAALDMVWATMFGTDPSNSTVKAQHQFCSSLKDFSLPADVDEAVTFPTALDPETMTSVMVLVDSMETSMKSPFPAQAHWFLRQKPSMRNAFAIKEKFIKAEVEKAERRIMEEKSTKTAKVRCAVDSMMAREIHLAEKEGRAPILHSRAMYDEILGFVVAAHDTLATTISWGLKFLADNADVQRKLRSEMRSALEHAVSEERGPTEQEITKTSIPYLDAVMEEIFRKSLTVPGVPRTAMVDTHVLGHHIPKGTDLFLMGNGPSVLSPAYQIDNSLRSAGARAAKDKVGIWYPEDIASFRPERWLKEEDGKTVFDPTAGPLLIFSLGPRGCYGRRMAYLQVRMVLVQIIWNFELQKCPPQLSGYGSVDRSVHAPQQCYVRLKDVK